MRQSRRRRANNIATKDKFKSAIKTVRAALSSGDKAKAQEALNLAFATLDKAAKKNVIHKNTANRKKGRLAKAINKLK